MDFERRLDKLEEDMYFGQGKDNPPIVTRLSKVEDALVDLRTMKWALITMALAAIGDIISRHVNF